MGVCFLRQSILGMPAQVSAESHPVSAARRLRRPRSPAPYTVIVKPVTNSKSNNGSSRDSSRVRWQGRAAGKSGSGMPGHNKGGCRDVTAYESSLSDAAFAPQEIGRASCREREWQYV